MASTQHFQAAVGGNINTTIRFVSDLVDDLTALRSAIVGITAKLDADAGVTDTTYGSLWNPAALKMTKGG